MEKRRHRAGVPTWVQVVLVFMVVWLAWPTWVWAEDEMRGNQVFFRGGFVGLSSDRGNELFTSTGQVVGAQTTSNDGTSGYYVGAGLDLMLSKNLWGMMNNISAVGEIGVEFKRFDSKTVINSTAVTPVSNLRPATVQITMLTVDVAPKLKFNQFGDLVPWIIPLGLDFHVISPPSNQTNYLDIGVQFGAGFEYRVWKELKAGLDARYHLASNQTNTTNSFFTVGPYVGIGF